MLIKLLHRSPSRDPACSPLKPCHVWQSKDNPDHLPLHPEQWETSAPPRRSWSCQGTHRFSYLIVSLANNISVGRFPSLNFLTPPQGRRKPHPVTALRAAARHGAYRLFPTDWSISPMPWRSDLLTTSTSTQGVAAREECLERQPGDIPSEQKRNQGNLPQAWILLFPEKLFHAASCATPLWSQCQDQRTELCEHDAMKSSLEANSPSIRSHCDPTLSKVCQLFTPPGLLG